MQMKPLRIPVVQVSPEDNSLTLMLIHAAALYPEGPEPVQHRLTEEDKAKMRNEAVIKSENLGPGPAGCFHSSYLFACFLHSFVVNHEMKQKLFVCLKLREKVLSISVGWQRIFFVCCRPSWRTWRNMRLISRRLQELHQCWKM